MEDCFKEGTNLESFFSSYLPKEYQKICMAIVKVLPIDKTLAFCIDLLQKNKKRKLKIFKILFYPILLLFVMMIFVLLFNQIVLPMMLNLVKSFHQVDSSLEYFVSILNYIITFFFLCCFILFCYITYSLWPKNIVKSYQRIYHYFPHSLFVKYYSEQFIQLYVLCIQEGLSTKESLDLINQLNMHPILSFLAECIHLQLMEGKAYQEAFEEAMLDEEVLRFLRLSSLSLEGEEILKTYLSFVQNKIERTMTAYAKSIQVISYSLIALMILFLYQILLLPLQIIQNL